MSTASEVFLIFTTQPYQYFSVVFLFALLIDKPEVFLPKYPQTAILHAAHFQRVVTESRKESLQYSEIFCRDIDRDTKNDIRERLSTIYPKGLPWPVLSSVMTYIHVCTCTCKVETVSLS